MEKGEWVRLRRGNDWGVNYYSVNPHRAGAACQKNRYRLVAGEEIRVRLKDSSLRVGIVKFRTTFEMVGDHGRFYPDRVDSQIPYVEFEDGTYVEIDACDIAYDPSRDGSL